MNLLSRWATGRNVILLLLIFLLMIVVVIPAVYPTFPTLDTLYSYTPEQAYQHIASYGDQGRQTYLVIELTLDLVYPLISALFFSLLIYYSFERGFPDHPWMLKLALLPFVELLADYLENASVVVLLLRYPARLDGLAALANVFTVAKFALSLPELLFLVGLVAWLIRTLRQRAPLKAGS